MKRKLLLMFVLGLLLVGCKGGQSEPVEAVDSVCRDSAADSVVVMEDG